LPASAELKRPLIEVSHPELSVRRQCELIGLNRSSLYDEPASETPENLRLMRLINEWYTAGPFYGSRRMTERLNQCSGYPCQRARDNLDASRRGDYPRKGDLAPGAVARTQFGEVARAA
jgi:putative transposase